MPCYKLYNSEREHTGFLCGQLGEHCLQCGDVAGYLCDYPVGRGKTCDRPLCEYHAVEIGPGIHYCPTHYAVWKKFRDGGGVVRELKNVLPYKKA